MTLSLVGAVHCTVNSTVDEFNDFPFNFDVCNSTSQKPHLIPIEYLINERVAQIRLSSVPFQFG